VAIPPMQASGKTPSFSTAGGWSPRGVGQWLLTVLSCRLAMITVALWVYFLHPADSASLPHGVGTRALSFSLHLLVVTIVAVELGLLAGWLRARLAGVSLA
jgi:hypothetical protein